MPISYDGEHSIVAPYLDIEAVVCDDDGEGMDEDAERELGEQILFNTPHFRLNISPGEFLDDGEDIEVESSRFSSLPPPSTANVGWRSRTTAHI